MGCTIIIDSTPLIIIFLVSENAVASMYIYIEKCTVCLAFSNFRRLQGILCKQKFCCYALPFVSFHMPTYLTNWLYMRYAPSIGPYISLYGLVIWRMWSHVCNKWAKLFILTFYAFKTKINEWGKWNRFSVAYNYMGVCCVEYRIRYKSLSECVAEIMWLIEWVFFLLLLLVHFYMWET